MPTYLYGLILARNTASMPSDIAGLQSSSARTLRCGELAAVVSTLEHMPGSATLEDVRAHDSVLQSVVESGATAVAVRFGQTFAGDEEACKHVVDRGGRVLSALREYDGCVEMRLLLAHDIEAATRAQPSTGPGTAYLEQLRAEREGIERLALKNALGPVVRAEHVEALPRERGVVFSHLVQREDVPSYREAVAALPALADAIPVGPLALYSFAEVET